MEILTIEIDTHEHAEDIKKILEKNPFVKKLHSSKALTDEDLVLGIGRPFSNDELEHYLNKQDFKEIFSKEAAWVEIKKHQK